MWMYHTFSLCENTNPFPNTKKTCILFRYACSVCLLHQVDAGGGSQGGGDGGEDGRQQVDDLLDDFFFGHFFEF